MNKYKSICRSPYKAWVIVMFFPIAYLLFSASVASPETYTCECEFDTDDYQAIGYFAGTCSYSMDETRRKCELRRASDYSDIKRSLYKTKIFGDPVKDGRSILRAAIEMYENPQSLVNFDATKVFGFLLVAHKRSSKI